MNKKQLEELNKIIYLMKVQKTMISRPCILGTPIYYLVPRELLKRLEKLKEELYNGKT